MKIGIILYMTLVSLTITLCALGPIFVSIINEDPTWLMQWVYLLPLAAFNFYLSRQFLRSREIKG